MSCAPLFRRSASTRSPLRQRGFTLIELMVATTISLLLLAAMVGMYSNLSGSQREMEKMNGLIENGRFAMQVLGEDVIHAGFWGGYVPQFDDFTSIAVPGDVPTVVPNPCRQYTNWNSAYRIALVGIPVQSYDALPVGAGCVAPLVQRPGTDVLVVRHTDTCVPGDVNCDAAVAGKLYLQLTTCAAERNAGTATSGGASTITLGANASPTDGAYVGLMLRTVSGVGAGQNRVISAYDGATHVATVSTAWTTAPDNTTTYSFEYVLGTTVFPLHKKDCVGTGTPATLPVTAGAIADKRRFISDIYYISDIPHPDNPGQVIPTLVRAQLDLASGTIAHQAPVQLVEGIEGFRVELGVDNISKTGAAVDYTQAVNWADPDTKTTPTNRGDGASDVFVRCTTALPCTAAQLMDVVAVNLYVLSRSRDPTPGSTDPKSYCLGEPAADGSCPAANTIAAANDQYKRHVFRTSVRVTNTSGRRDTP